MDVTHDPYFVQNKTLPRETAPVYYPTAPEVENPPPGAKQTPIIVVSTICLDIPRVSK